MKSVFTCLIVCLIGGASFAQIAFEKGYFITTTGERVEALLHSVTSGENPEAIEYKLLPTEREMRVPIQELKEFGIYERWKYLVATVDFDRIETNLTNIGVNRNPQFKKETLALRVLIEGKADLFSYELPQQTVFFFRTEQSDIRQLIWKRYKVSQLEVRANNLYQQQLWTDVRCNVTEAELSRLDYDAGSLKKYFTNYNHCSGADIGHQDRARRGKFHLDLLAGAGSANMGVKGLRYLTGYPDREFNDSFIPHFGLQLEFLFPSETYSRGVIISAVHQSFSGKSDKVFNADPEYRSLLLSIGLRQYFFNKQKVRPFVNVLGTFDLRISDDIGYLELKTRSTLAPSIGIGLNYKNFALETRYDSRRDIISRQSSAETDFSKLMFLFSYRIF